MGHTHIMFLLICMQLQTKVRPNQLLPCSLGNTSWLLWQISFVKTSQSIKKNAKFSVKLKHSHLIIEFCSKAKIWRLRFYFVTSVSGDLSKFFFTEPVYSNHYFTATIILQQPLFYSNHYFFYPKHIDIREWQDVRKKTKHQK